MDIFFVEEWLKNAKDLVPKRTKCLECAGHNDHDKCSPDEETVSCVLEILAESLRNTFEKERLK
jgi:hypothetical protein